MIRKINIFTILLFCMCQISFAQNNDSLFSRLQGISNSGTDFYNVDGIEITSQSIANEFSKKAILKKFKKYSIRADDLNTTDSLLGLPNFYVSKSEQINNETIQNTSYYFIENSNKGLTAVTFGSVNKADRSFERQFVKLINDNSIPKSIYEPVKIDSINFAGRKISLGSSCNWMGVNNVQCPYYGQMNWSVHKTLDDASQSATNQYNIIKEKKGGKIISEELVDVIFEGTEVKAKKLFMILKELHPF